MHPITLHVIDPITLRSFVNVLKKTLKRPLMTPSHQRVTETISVTAIIRARNPIKVVNINLTNQTPVKINRTRRIK